MRFPDPGRSSGSRPHICISWPWTTNRIYRPWLSICVCLFLIECLSFLDPSYDLDIWPSSYLTPLAPICVYQPGPLIFINRPWHSICIYRPQPSIRIYRPWLTRTEIIKSQRLHIMSLLLFMLSNSFVTVIADKNEKKRGNISKKQISK